MMSQAVKTIQRRSSSVISPIIQESKGFQDIPAIPYGKVPIIGNGWQLAKQPAGKEQFWKNVLELRAKYLTENDTIMRLNLPLLNPSGKGRCVWIFNAEDVERLFQFEPKYPTKGPVLSTFKLIRKRLPGLSRREKLCCYFLLHRKHIRRNVRSCS